MDLNSKIVNATKWSTITEVIAKLITPITSIVLARLLTPEAFGIVASITMIISFAEIFTDAGFQKFLVQHNFKDDLEKEQCINVAFWSNLVLSFIIWGGISVFRNSLATLVGNPNLGNALAIACVSIPLAAFSSIQMALYKRDFNFKTLFKVRLISIFIPLFFTIPLAFILRNYWALIIGTIISNLANALLLTFFSNWSPRFFFSFEKLKEMFSFTFWSMIEAVSIWLTGYVDIFIIGIYLNGYYLGLYKTSITLVGQIMNLIICAITPVLFSSLSRLQDDPSQFKILFLKFQKIVGVFIIPMGVGLFCFRDFVTVLLLGEQWIEASDFIGLWGLTSAVTIVLSHFSSEVYRSLGRPKLSVLSQFLHLIVLCPVVYISINYGFQVLYTARALVRLEGILVNLILMYYLIRMSPLVMFKNISVSIFSSLIMALCAFLLLNINDSFSLNFIYIFLCVIMYFLVVCAFPRERMLMISILKKGIYRLLKNK